MDINYKKDLNHNYLIVKNKEKFKEEEYCIRMIQRQKPSGILSIDKRNIDMEEFFYYDITGKQSFKILWENKVVERKDVKKLLLDIINTLEKSGPYLLSENDFILQEEFIYLQLPSKKVSLTYMPGYNKNIKLQLTEFIALLMNKVDYKDKEAVILIYNLYSVSREDGYQIKDLGEILLKPEEEKTKTQKKIKGVEDIFEKEGQTLENQQIVEASAKEKVKEKGAVRLIKQEITSEGEVYYYPWTNYLYTGISFLICLMVVYLCFAFKLVYNSFANKVDYGKLFYLCVFVVGLEGYILKVVWDKKTRLTKIEEKIEFTEKIIGNENSLEDINQKNIEQDENNDKNQVSPIINLEDENYDQENPTIFLGRESSDPLLRPYKREMSPIVMDKSPFIIGKLKDQVDYCLNYEGISRYHIKFEQEAGEFYIMDLNSTNGTKVNNKELASYEKIQIKEKDIITIANIKYDFVRESPFNS